MIPTLPPHCETREEFIDGLEAIYDFYSTCDMPFRLSAFGFWGNREDEQLEGEARIEKRHGGCMFSVFTGPREEPIGTIRSNIPIPDAFRLVDGIKARLRKAGRVVGYYESYTNPTHILTIPRPGNPEQTWEYGIDADDAEAIRLFLVNEAVRVRRYVQEAEDA